MRARNEGYIRQHKDGRWEAQIRQPDGSKESLYGRSRREVARRLGDALAAQRLGLPAQESRQRLDRYLEGWLEVVRDQVAATTWKNDEALVRNHISPLLGRVPIGELTPADVEHFLARKLAQPLAPQTVIHLRGLLRRALQRAVKHGLVGRNVASLASPPRMRRVRDWHALDEEAARVFLGAVEGHWLEALWVLYLMTGLRRGEALALRWRDVDLVAGKVTVRGSLQSVDGVLRTGPTKTTQSERTLELPGLAREALLRHHRRRPGVKHLPTAFVFCSDRGGPIHPSNVNRSFRRLLASGGLNHMRITDLRHSFATLMLARDEHPKVVQEALGHSSIVHTMNTYSHVMPGLKKGAAARLDQLLRGSSPVSSPVNRGEE
jgi:integrase